MQVAQGTVLAHRYRVVGLLGRGGAAHTYRVEDLLERGELALKLLDPARSTEELRLEFERVRGLVHPHLMQVHDFALVELFGKRRALYTASLVPGGDLRSAAQLGFGAVRRACGDVLAALHMLHRAGLRHGDVKPENVLVDERGRAVLIDFGCAAPLGRAAPLLSGTPGYLAPELTRGYVADERADLYAFGVLLRELFSAPELAPLIARLCAEDVAARPSSAREVLALLGDERDVDEAVLGRAARCIGRDVELTTLLSAVTQAVEGREGPRCVWLQGAPGVGRSRMLRELRFAMASRGCDLLEAGAHCASPIRDALARKYGALEPGIEALLAQLAEAAQARDPTVCVLDDAERLDAEAQRELAIGVRALAERGRFVLLVASSQAPPDASALHTKLAPLGVAALAEWARGVLAAEQVAQLARYTGGYPRYVERALAAIVEGRLQPADLQRASQVELDTESTRSLELALAGLSSREQRALLQVAIGNGPDERASATMKLTRLFARDLVVRQGERVVLSRTADRDALLARLDVRMVREHYEKSARALAGEANAEARASAVEHFLRAGQREQAERLLGESRELAARAPRLFAQRLAPLAHLLQPPTLLELAVLTRLAGEAPRALSLLARLRRALGRHPGARHVAPTLYREAAEVCFALGRFARARALLRRAGAPDDPSNADLCVRILVRQGAYREAGELAERVLPAVADDASRARLLEALALCAAYLGDSRAARERLTLALPLIAQSDVRARARSFALRGFVLARAGASADAVEAYSEALRLAEQAGLADLVLNALANLANARQSLGHFGAALSLCDRALRLARALGRRESVRSARANLANLALEIGNFARVESELTELAQGAETAALSVSIRLYRAELALLEGDDARALAQLSSLQSLAVDTDRERVEARALELIARSRLREHARVGALLAASEAEPCELPPDMSARKAEAEAAALDFLGRPREALTRLEAAYRPLREGGDEALLARLEGALSALCRALSADALATEHARHARARWERIALDLPPALREAFWAHPRRRELTRNQERAKPVRSTLSLARVRELNRRISALHTPDEVLTFALDAAIELTGAERGFVLLVRERGFEVLVAHEMDQKRTPRSEWKWSRSIAERVIRECEPVLTVDAGRDPRFLRQASVHAMQLKSVLCAPIRAQSGVLGALYLDNRLARARFADEDAELLLTFADQVAIALRHAELVRELSQRARELEREKRKVEELARGQALEIERLSDELSSQRAELETRYDYTNIVGRSEPMRRVLSLLDRVMETDLSVLVQGESGTGKELVARALHMHGARKAQPFVSINCAALPEPLLESELFGHVKGAFTGAVSAREGLFVRARGGTLFLDELGELPLAMQAKLLRVLNDGEVRPVGATKSFAVDVRIIAATNIILKQRVEAGLFREDLYYRLSVVELTLPALRERHEDIVPIAEALLTKRAEELGQARLVLSADAIRALLKHPWPGNVRELQNTLLRASVMAVGGVIHAADLELVPQRVREVAVTPTSRDEYAKKEAERLLSALAAERWNVSKVAKNLGIPRNTLYRKLARYGIQRNEP